MHVPCAIIVYWCIENDEETNRIARFALNHDECILNV